MFAFGFILLAVGLYLADSAVKNRNPVETLTKVVQEPKRARATLAERRPSDLSSLLLDPLSVPDNAPTYSGGDGIVGKIIGYAQAQIGKPYGWGAEGPNAFDCSGLIWAAYKSAGITIPRTTATMQLPGSGTRVARKHLRPGDLVFPDPGHVMLYIGGGRCIESPRLGGHVQYTTVYRFFTARRYL